MTEDVTTCLKRMPRKVKIGAYDWSIVLEDGPNDKCGQADFEFHTIRLWADNLTSPNHIVGIVLHECFHVIYDNEKLSSVKGKRDDREERIVVGFECGTISLLRDNPKLMTWIKKELK